MKIVSTTRNKAWQEHDHITVGNQVPQLYVTGNRKQTIRGFGGCFNELGKIALNELSPDRQQQIYKELFSVEGCNFNFNRLPVGANDFSEIWYSCNETDGDYEMKHFSIERDLKYIIPYIREAQKHQEAMQLFASPWSPPTWMKFPKAYNFGTLVQTEDNLKAYALYFKKFIESYKAQDIKINQLHIQNEPMSTQKFPSCIWSGKELCSFIANYLFDAFREGNIDTDIFLGTLNGGSDFHTHFNAFLNVVMDDAICQKAVKGVGYQWDGKSAIAVSYDAFPELEYIQTESECGDGRNSYEYAMYIFGLIRHYMRFGSTAYVYWNIALKKGGESTWGWCQNSLVTIDHGEVTYNPEFYVMKHFSHFVKRGAKYIELTGRWNANSLCFENPDGEIILVVMNPFEETKDLTFDVKGKTSTIILEPHSFTTVAI